MSHEHTPTALDLPPVPESDLADDLQTYFAKCRSRLGLVPNVLRAYSFDEAKLRAFMGFYNELMLGDSGLDKLEREMIAVVVSAQNRCHYCMTAHGQALRQLCGDPGFAEAVMMNYRSAPLTPRWRAMLDFAWQLTVHPDQVEEAHRLQLRDAGFSERDLWDIAAVTSFFNMSNRMASATGMAPNPEYHSMSR
jgi:uncharacterized peroxidase-related enzyme